MFELTHLIWLFISVLLIFSLTYASLKFKWSYEKVLTIMCIISSLSEVIKIFNNMNLGYNDGRYLDVGSLPFHLCTIQIFFFFILKFNKTEKVKDKILGFMLPTSMLGASLALLIPTCGSRFDEIQPYQYFIFHAALIFFSIYILKIKNVKITKKTYFRNVAYLLVLFIFEIWINSILSFGNANFLYVSRPPMSGLPILNLNHGWYIYIIHLIMVGLTLITLWHLPFIIKERKIANKQ